MTPSRTRATERTPVTRVYLAPTAVVAADVRLGPGVSLWYGAVVRGDVAPITIGEGSNVQDGAVVHCDYGVPNDVGDGVVIGHGAVVHGRRVGARTLVGMGARLLGGTVVGEECLVAAGAVVPPGMVVPPRSLVVGVPARVVRAVTDEELATTAAIAARYQELARRYTAGEIGGPDGVAGGWRAIAANPGGGA